MCNEYIQAILSEDDNNPETLEKYEACKDTKDEYLQGWER